MRIRLQRGCGYDARVGERERIDLLRAIFAGSEGSVLVDIGDDAAVLDPRAPVAWSVDAVVEDVHFRREWLSLRDLGFKASMAAASDLAAMGARPLGALASLVLPATFSDADLNELAEGQAEACTALGMRLVGGNLARGPSLSVTTTVLGACGPHVMRRSGAQVGDALYCAGPPGLAAAGLRALQSNRSDPVLAPALAAWRRPIARIAEGLRALPSAHAAIDVSDGLSLDASRLLDGSLDGALDVVLEATIVSPELAAAAGALGVDALALALAGGEDYALLVAAPPATTLEGFARVGRFEGGSGNVWLEEAGSRRRIEPQGFDHFAP
jgi:thiamine-monophosphate kinase